MHQMTRLVRMRLQDFRSFASIDVELDDLTVLVGPNAPGKSNLVDGFRFISDAFQRGLELAFDDRGVTAQLLEGGLVGADQRT